MHPLLEGRGRPGLQVSGSVVTASSLSSDAWGTLVGKPLVRGHLYPRRPDGPNLMLGLAGQDGMIMQLGQWCPHITGLVQDLSG